MDDTTKCRERPQKSNRDWWPNQLDLSVLHQHSSLSDPMGEAFDYAKEFKSPT
jgi:catalase-peroxidase